MKDIQILVIDDSPSFILYITDLFKKHGYKNFYVAYDKDMAEQILKENHIQIVLLDIELNTIKEGFQFGEYIQKHYDLPVIYITGKNEEEIKSLLEQRNKDMIFYGLLYKPFKFSELEILIQNAIQNVYHKKIQEKSLKRLLELIPEPTVVIHKDQIYDYNNLFINFIKKELNLNYVPSNILDITPELNSELLADQTTELERFEGYIHINSKPFKLEILPLSEEYFQIIFYQGSIAHDIQVIDVNKFDFIINVLNRIMEGVFILNEKREFIYINPMFLEMYQYNEEEILGKSIKVITNKNYPLSYYIKIWRSIEKNQIYEGKIHSTTKNGQERVDWVFIHKILDTEKNKKYYMGIVTDLKQKLKYEEQLFYLAHYDDLTGLPNRRYFKEVLKKEIYRAKRNNTKFALIFIDLDNFKHINDRYGHMAGDNVLKHFANYLKKTLRKTDSIFRYAGDEFCVLINNFVHAENLVPVLEKILKINQTPILYNNHQFFLSLSIGVSIFPDDLVLNQRDLLTLNEEEIENKILILADSKMYEAKKSGGNKYRFSSETLNQYSIFREKLKLNEISQIELNYYLIFDNQKRLIAVQPLIRIKDLTHHDSEKLALYLETNIDKEILFVEKLLYDLENERSFWDTLQNQQISLYLRFTLVALLNKEKIEKLLKYKYKIILEIYEQELYNLIDYHHSYLNYLLKNNIKICLKQPINKNLFSVKEISLEHIFAVLPFVVKNSPDVEDKLKLKIFVENMSILEMPVMLEFSSEEEKNVVYQLNSNFYKDKMKQYSIEELKNILH